MSKLEKGQQLRPVIERQITEHEHIVDGAMDTLEDRISL